MSRTLIHRARHPAIFMLVALAVGCEAGDRPSTNASDDQNLEFAFPGGQVEAGRVVLAPDAEYTHDKATGKVVARMANSAGTVELDCSCFLEGSGFCFLVEMPDPNNRHVFACGYNQACAGQTMDFCVMSINKSEGFRLKFRSPATRVGAAGTANVGSCNAPLV